MEVIDRQSRKEKIRLYIGYAPGKTTALNGVVLRALGAGLKVKLILFSKSPNTTSESKVYEVLKKNYPDNFDYFFSGISRVRPNGTFRYYGDPDGWTSEDESKLKEGVKQLFCDISSGNYDLLCLDELTDLLYHKEQRINEKKAKEIFNKLHDNTMLVITGHLCPRWLIDMASTVIEGKIHKHYSGTTKGIEW